jgi:hypothetical protein
MPHRFKEKRILTFQGGDPFGLASEATLQGWPPYPEPLLQTGTPAAIRYDGAASAKTVLHQVNIRFRHVARFTYPASGQVFSDFGGINRHVPVPVKNSRARFGLPPATPG